MSLLFPSTTGLPGQLTPTVTLPQPSVTTTKHGLCVTRSGPSVQTSKRITLPVLFEIGGRVKVLSLQREKQE